MLRFQDGWFQIYIVVWPDQVLGNSTKIISRGLLKEIIIKSIVYLHNGQVDITKKWKASWCKLPCNKCNFGYRILIFDSIFIYHRSSRSLIPYKDSESVSMFQFRTVKKLLERMEYPELRKFKAPVLRDSSFLKACFLIKENFISIIKTKFLSLVFGSLGDN